jgi:dihydrofolate reductase
MSKLIVEVSMSLNGYIAFPNDEVGPLFDWYYSGDTDLHLPGTDMTFKVSRASAELLRESWGNIGAGVTGRRTFDVAHGWAGNPPGGGRHFVVTHRVPQEWDQPGSPFAFVTDGVKKAVETAKQAAGDKNVSVTSANIAQQCLKAGLLDEIHIDLVPVLLGGGIRLFGNLGSDPIRLEIVRVVEGKGVTHLQYRVVK